MLELRQILAENKPDIETVREMFEEYQRELSVDLCFQSFQEELDTLPGKYGPPRGSLYLAFYGGQLAGCGALRPLEDGCCEIKRIYVRTSFRKLGIARAMSQKLLEDAASRGYQTVKLDTLARLEGALSLYRSLGFRETTPYNFNPEADIVYMEKPV